jgi:hypothetical protein
MKQFKSIGIGSKITGPILGIVKPILKKCRENGIGSISSTDLKIMIQRVIPSKARRTYDKYIDVIAKQLDLKRVSLSFGRYGARTFFLIEKVAADGVKPSVPPDQSEF